MIIAPDATAAAQISGHVSRKAMTTAHPFSYVLFAKRQPATPVRKLRLAPAGGFLVPSEVLAFWRPAIIWSSCLKVYLHPVFPPEGPRFDGGLVSKLKDRPYRPGRSPHWKE